MTLAVPPRTNIPRPTKKDPKDTLERAYNKLAWGFFSDGGSTVFHSGVNFPEPPGTSINIVPGRI